ncbi:hypothetical protein ACO0LF_18245 [Undibacterium sp. Di27W]|uniref:hypothetical protein n=1 Tax=Undibacterium sp. Di27W TaxID=3413036 RepID=UPI003BF029E1
MLELLYYDTIVGYVSKVLHDDGAWFTGDIELSSASDDMRSFFEYLVDENDIVEIKWPPGWIDENNWSLRDTESSAIRGISLPAIYLDDGSIYWRWRE